MSDEALVNVRILVDDVAASVDFYTRHFGFEPLNHFPAFADVQRGGLRLLLSGPQSSAAQPMADGEQPRPGGWNRIHFIVDDLDAEVEASVFPKVQGGQFGTLRFCYLDTWDALGQYVELVEDPDGMMMSLMPWR
jgi:catechol 2,3-dioxygenase-like lactoylglutathione lyase family enzyme